LPHCKHSDSDENNRARQIAEQQVSSVSSQAPLRHLSANAGVGREWLVMAEPGRAGPAAIAKPSNDQIIGSSTLAGLMARFAPEQSPSL